MVLAEVNADKEGWDVLEAPWKGVYQGRAEGRSDH